MASALPGPLGLARDAFFSRKQGVDQVQPTAKLGGSAGRLRNRSTECDLWQFGSSISFGFGRRAIVTGDRKVGIQRPGRQRPGSVPSFGNHLFNRQMNLFRVRNIRCDGQETVFRGRRSNQLKGLILAQSERWRRGLGMQVEREVCFGRRTAAKGTVMCRYLPSGPG